MNTKQQILETLDKNWNQFFNNVTSLNESDLKAYLDKQGYSSLKDLLAHIVGWWELTIDDAKLILENPNYDNPVDIDEFNADAVRKYKDLSENEMIEKFKSTLEDFKKLIENLSEEDLKHPKLQEWIHNAEIEHYEEHKVDKPQTSNHEPQTTDLQAQLNSEKQKRIELMADFQNFKRRVEQEKATWGAISNLALIQELLEVYDDLQLALQDENLTLDHAKTSIRSAQDKLAGASLRAGVEKVDVKVGDDFDKEKMEAVSMVAAGNENKGKVIAVISSAYKYSGRDGILKAAKVVVGK